MVLGRAWRAHPKASAKTHSDGWNKNWMTKWYHCYVSHVSCIFFLPWRFQGFKMVEFCWQNFHRIDLPRIDSRFTSEREGGFSFPWSKMPSWTFDGKSWKPTWTNFFGDEKSQILNMWNFSLFPCLPHTRKETNLFESPASHIIQQIYTYVYTLYIYVYHV